MARGDGSVYLRKNSSNYWMQFFLHGKKHRESTGESDEEAARGVLKRRLKEVHASEVTGRVFESAKMRRLTVSDLCDALESDFTIRGKWNDQNRSHLKRVRHDFGDLLAISVTPEQIDNYIKSRLAVKLGRDGERAPGDRPATINRALQMLRQAFRLAFKRGTISRVPYVRTLSEAGNERKISVNESQLADFLAALPNDGLRDFAQWCSACAMRSGEAKKLTWDMLHGEELRIPGHICKNRDGRVVPVTGELAEIIERRKKARRMDCRFIFHRQGEAVNEYRKSVATARRKANLPNGVIAQERFVFHSLRSVAATNLIHAGVAPSIAMKVGGWKTDAMLRRYCILTTDDVREALARTEAYRAAEKAKQKVTVVAMR